MCTGTDYYMYIPSELNLYYVYAVHNTFHELNIHQDPSPLNTILTTSTSTPNDESNSPHVSNSDTQLTSEDFETLLAVLEDNKSIERGNQTPNELNK